MKFLKVKEKNLSEKVGEMAELIKSGSVVVCPTDTVYGLISLAGDKKAVAKIFQIKKRPQKKPLPVFVRSIAMARKLTEINKNQEEFLKKVWPGRITVVLKSKKGGTLGLRVPENKFILNLIKTTGPLAETSANLSGQSPTTKIEEVLRYFKGRKYQPDLVLDAGDLKPAKPSQVIDLTGPVPVILRK